MSLKLLQNIIIEKNDGMEVLPEGTIISEVSLDLDTETDETEVGRDKMLGIVQQWIDRYKPSFGKSWSKVIDFLQPAIEAIHSNDIQQLKSATIKLAERSEQLAETNPQAKQAIDRIHDLYVKLLGMARGTFGESIDEIIDIITECREKIAIL